MRIEILNNSGDVTNTVLADSLENAVKMFGPKCRASTVQDPTPAPTEEDTTLYIDERPFFDRFEASQLEVLKSTDPDMKAFITTCSGRKWIFTKHPMIVMGIDRAISLGIPGVDAAMKDRIMNRPARWSEQEALIKVYFPKQEATARARR